MAKVIGDSADPAVPAVKGTNTGNKGVGVEGSCDTGWGVHGHSKTGRGVVASSEADYGLRASSLKSAGIRGSSVEGRGVEGWATKGEGVVGISTTGTGIWGQTESTGIGVLGTSKSGIGVKGHTDSTGSGVLGTSKSGIGVVGESTSGRGVVARSDTDYGLRASSRTLAGIRGSSVEGRGVEGWATKSEGVVGISTTGNGVWGQTEGEGIGVLGTSKSGVGVHGQGGRLAGFFEGDVEVTGDISLKNADCAEDFDVSGADKVEPGTVMVLGNEGALFESQHAYDRRVAGVISGAGDYRPGIVLDKQQSQGNRQPVALVGKVFCKVDAHFGPIEVGDLLTTSATPGYAMKVTDPLRAFGAVIGKALRPLKEGQGLIPILIALQ